MGRSAMNGVKFFPLDHMRMEDMRAKEPLQVGDTVLIDGGMRFGILVEFDADRRLARVASAGNRGWYYVKDLTVVRHASKERAQPAAPLQENLEFHTQEDALCQLPL